MATVSLVRLSRLPSEDLSLDKIIVIIIIITTITITIIIIIIIIIVITIIILIIIIIVIITGFQAGDQVCISTTIK
jgi:hypothetical protein